MGGAAYAEEGLHGAGGGVGILFQDSVTCCSRSVRLTGNALKRTVRTIELVPLISAHHEPLFRLFSKVDRTGKRL